MDYLVIFISCFACILIGGNIERGKWIGKAKHPARMLSRGKFYFVVEDGDRKRLKRISNCFDASEAGSGYENKIGD